MPRYGKKESYTSISLPKDLMNEIELFIKDKPDIRSQTEFVRRAIIEKMDRDYKLKDRAIDKIKGTFTKQEKQEIKKIIKEALKEA